MFVTVPPVRLIGIVLAFGLAPSLPLFADDGFKDDQQKVKVLLVDDDKQQCPTAGFTKIQDAVNAASSGATIRVCAGTYAEQVTITKPVTINGDNGAIVIPSPVVTNSTDLVSPISIAAVVLVMNTTDVTLSGLTLDGAQNGIATCQPDLVGIYYRNASGAIRNNTVRNMKLGAGLGGCQSGEGIFVQSSLGSSKVTIDTNSVHDFQKNGITGNEGGTTVTVVGNVVTGLGPTSGAAQNGIQIGYGASGSVNNNISSNHVWLPCVSVANCAAIATDIVVIQSDGINITNNTTGRSQSGIFVLGNNANVRGNTVFDTLIFDGIGFQGNRNQANNNTVTKSDESGIYVDGNNNNITNNTIQDAPIGILKVAGSTGLNTQGNQYINVPIPTMDPAGRGNMISPYR